MSPVSSQSLLGEVSGDLAAEAAPLGPKPAAKVDMAAMVPAGAAALVDQLDNRPGQGAPAGPADDDEETATLDFVGDELPETTVPLRYPFRWEGVHHTAVTVRQLTTGEVGRVSAEWGRTGKAPKLIDVYAAMTGLPARVLRGMISVDGDAVFAAAYDFLPPSFRGEGD